MSFVRVCPVDTLPTGACPVEEVWQQLTHVGLTYGQFLQIMPHLVAMLFAALTIRWLVRLIFNSR